MRYAALLFFAALAIGQVAPEPVVTRSYSFTHNESAQDIQEVATLLKTIGDIRDTAADVEQKTIKLTGTASQAAMADWLFNEVEKPQNQRPLSQRGHDSEKHEYFLPQQPENVVRVFYLTGTKTIQDFQEVATVIRTIGEVRRVFTYNTPRALVMRGTAPQMALADWFYDQLDQPASLSGTHEFQMPDTPSDPLVRLFYLPQSSTVQDFQGAATFIRTLAEIRRVFTYNAPRAVSVRGTADQIKLASWIVDTLAQPAAKNEFWISADGKDVVRLFYLSPSFTREQFQAVAKTLGATTAISKVFTFDAPHCLAVRASLDEVVRAEQFLKELSQ